MICRMAALLSPALLFFSSLLPTAAAAGPQWKTQKIEGWTVHVRDTLLTEQPEATEKALTLFTTQLQEIIRVVPPRAVEELRKVPIWFSPEYKGEQPRAEYHPVLAG